MKTIPEGVDKCPTCGRFVSIEDGFGDRRDRSDDLCLVEVWCSEECADQFPRTPEQAKHWSDDS